VLQSGKEAQKAAHALVESYEKSKNSAAEAVCRSVSCALSFEQFVGFRAAEALFRSA
jgi:hypothetical protein